MDRLTSLHAIVEQPLPSSTNHTTATGGTSGNSHSNGGGGGGGGGYQVGRVDRRGSQPHLPSSGVEWEDDDADNVPALRSTQGQGLASSVERKRNGHIGNGSGSGAVGSSSSSLDLSNYTPMNKGNRHHAGGGSSR